MAFCLLPMTSKKAKIEELQTSIASKWQASTDRRRERKSKNSKKLKKNILHLSVYQCVLEVFENYTMLSQRDEPLIHKVYAEQHQLVRSCNTSWCCSGSNMHVEEKPEQFRCSKCFEGRT